jgi:hypothetical protein
MEEENTTENVDTQSMFNPENGKLPFGYFDPKSEGKLYWICNYDGEGRITSVVCYDYGTDQDKRVVYLDSMEKAIELRDEFIKGGWKKLVPPKVTFTYPGQKEGQPLNRKQRRYLERRIQRMDKKTNPYKN